MPIVGTSKKKPHRPTARIGSALAKKLLSSVPQDKGFSFYLDIDIPTGNTANSLQDFCQCLLEVEPRSIAFHLEREDFQNWLKKVVGDEELASKLSSLKGIGFPPEELKSKVCNEVKTRFDELFAIVGKK